MEFATILPMYRATEIVAIYGWKKKGGNELGDKEWGCMILKNSG